MKIRANAILIYIIAAFTVFAIFLVGLYKWCIPAVVNSSFMADFITKQAKKTMNIDLGIKRVELSTGMEIAFKVDNFTIDKNGKSYLTLSDIDTLFSLKELYHKRIVVKKILAKNVYVDAYNLPMLFPKEDKKKEKKKCPVNLDFYNTLLGVKNVYVVYHSPNFDVDLKAKHAIFDRTNNKKFLHLDFVLDIQKAGHRINISANDQNRIFMENHVAYVKDFPIEIEKSKIIINALMTNKGEYELQVSAKDFSAGDVADIVNSNLVVENGSQMLQSIKNIRGNVDFDVKMTKNSFNGEINIKKVDFEIIPLLDMPVKINKGKVIIGNNDIEYKDFEGYYNNKKTNTLALKGNTKDYHKTCDTKLESDIFVTNDFFKNYLSKILLDEKVRFGIVQMWASGEFNNQLQYEDRRQFLNQPNIIK